MKLTINTELPLSDLVERLSRAGLHLTGRVLRDSSHEVVCVQTETLTCDYPECSKRNPSVQVEHKLYCPAHALIVMQHEPTANSAR